jgi:hypothetical protein
MTGDEIAHLTESVCNTDSTGEKDDGAITVQWLKAAVRTLNGTVGAEGAAGGSRSPIE